MQVSAKEILALLGGTIEGDPDIVVTKPAKIEESQEGDISFIANPKYVDFAYSTKASVLLIQSKMQLDQPVNATLIRVDEPYEGFSKILHLFDTSADWAAGIDPLASIHADADVSDKAYVGPLAYISEGSKVGKGARVFAQAYIGEGVEIGENTVIYSGVRVLNHCVIGKNCIVHSGAIIGSDGFGFIPDKNLKYNKIPQIGNVQIDDDVEIGANCTIDRATMGSTHIHRGVKIDNLVQVAHNVEIGEDTVIVAQTGISGSTKIGKRCVIGGQVGFVGHISIADDTKINAKSGVSKNVKETGTALNGIPAYDYNSSLRSQAVYRRLPELEKKLDAIIKKMKDQSKGE